MNTKHIAALSAGAILAAAPSAQEVHFNEIYISHSGIDTLEYFELIGTPGLSLDNHMILVVEGQGGGAGTLDVAIDLTGFTIPADGYFVVGDTAVANLDLDLGADNAIENGEETIYLVDAGDLTGVNELTFLVGSNIQVSPAATVIPSMSTIIDLVGVSEGVFGNVIYDGAEVLGPDGIFFPAGIYRGDDYPNAWCPLFLDFDPTANADQPRTPGTMNVPCVTDSLLVDTDTISLSAGGMQNFTLDGGAANAGSFWWVFGSVTGTAPGLDFGGGIILPLNFDPYFNLTLSKPFLAIFTNYIGVLDGSGSGAAALTIPSGADPSLAGVTLFHAYTAAATFGITDFASNAVEVLLDV